MDLLATGREHEGTSTLVELIATNADVVGHGARVPPTCGTRRLARRRGAFASSCGSHAQMASWFEKLMTTPSQPLPVRPGADVWVVGMPRLVVTSTNGGATWRTAHKDASGNLAYQLLRGVAFADARHGWAVGKGGTILATTNGGVTWTTQRSSSAENLVAVAAVDAKHAWVVGFDNAGQQIPGIILATSDGGKRWRTQNEGSLENLTSVAFPDARHGWAVGWSGDIRRQAMAVPTGASNAT